ncbi:MAG: putative aminohydrolase SsnA [Candidatus Aminicenantes bacterium]|nr:putative aminohydrolase SsnA [Candidatus Aminicenantes bacterium]
MAERLLIANGPIFTGGEDFDLLEGHGLLIGDGRVAKIAPLTEIRSENARLLDARGKLVMPGLVNAHMHFYSTLVRGLGKAAPARDFGEVLRNLWWRLDRKLTLEDTYHSALLMMLAAVRRGATTLIDHHASPGAITGSLDRIARAGTETGLRIGLAYEISDRDGPEAAAEGLAENAAAVRFCREHGGEHLRALVGLHASFTLSDETLDRAAALAAERGVGCHIHAAEAAGDQEDCRTRHGLRVVERLRRRGILGPKTIAAHAVHVDRAEVETLAASGTMVVHNPQSNLNNAVGIADIVAMKKAGVLVGLGTDAMTVDMLEELRVAIWAQHYGRGDPSQGFGEATGALFAGNPAIAERVWGLPLGRIREGGPADVVLVDYDPPTPLDKASVLGHLVFGASQSTVDTTIVAGRVLMENKRLKLDIDEERVAVRSRELAAALWERF